MLFEGISGFPKNYHRVTCQALIGIIEVHPSRDLFSLIYSSPFSHSNPGSSGAGSGSSNSQADTVPIDNSDHSNSPPADIDNLISTKAWGILYAIKSELYDNVHLESDTFSVGRDRTCDYRIKEEHGFGKSKELKCLYTNISKIHFKIYKEKDDLSDIGFSVRLEILSQNGTFVNGLKVAQGRKVNLGNCSRISLSRKENEAFIFVNVKIMLLEYYSLPQKFREIYDLE